jgi:hypothetical protein
MTRLTDIKYFSGLTTIIFPVLCLIAEVLLKRGESACGCFFG